MRDAFSRAKNLMQCIKEINYLSESYDYFMMIRRLGFAAWLDSGCTEHSARRFDVLCAGPEETLRLDADGLVSDSAGRSRRLEGDVFSDINKWLRDNPDNSPDDAPPFRHGWLGYIAYDGAGSAGLAPPGAIMCRYGWSVVQDHVQRKAWLCARDAGALLRGEQALASAAEPAGDFALQGRFVATSPEDDYASAFARVQAYLRAGDCYQVNLARHWCAPFEGDPLAAYRALRRHFAGPYSAFLDFGDTRVLSLSPELLLGCRRGQLRTSPIKGTRPRGLDSFEDNMLRDELETSSKDRAENLMIVDLLRNDFGRVCEPGSVQVSRLFGVESFRNVHHLVSTVEGRLASGLTAIDALSSCFPGGSITGAPKRRAMEIIRELEPAPRSVYCGSIGYLEPGGGMQMNIAIRTLLCHGGQIHCWGGGGLVADSDCAQEFEETEHKVGGMMRLLEQL